MEENYLLDKLQWLAGMLDVQKNFVSANLENRKKWNNSHFDLVNIATFSDEKLANISSDQINILGKLYQSIIQFSSYGNNLISKYAELTEYEDIGDQYLMLVLPEEDTEEYILELEKIINNLNEFISKVSSK